eukprot:3003606-Rhodomonas_salina.3
MAISLCRCEMKPRGPARLNQTQDITLFVVGQNVVAEEMEEEEEGGEEEGMARGSHPSLDASQGGRKEGGFVNGCV